MAPDIVEDDQGTAYDCGAALFHRGPTPSPLCATIPDPWRPAAAAGLLLAACLVLTAVALLALRRRRFRRLPG
jgi:hypothetical protein